MLNARNGLIVICCLFPLLGYSSVLSATNNQSNELKKLYQAKNYQTVIRVGNVLLLETPDNPDARLFLGLAYYQTRQYNKAYEILNTTLASYPDYLDVRLALINTLLAQKRYSKAFEIIQEGLERHADDVSLQMAKVKLMTLQGKELQAVKELNDILNTHQNYQPAIDLKKKLTLKARHKKKSIKRTIANDQILTKETQSQYVFSMFTNNMDVTMPAQYWNYSSVSLYRHSENVHYGIELNYANRFNHNGIQGGLVFMPKLSRNTQLRLAYFSANQPELFPDHTVYGELYQNVLDNVTVSGGGYYQKLSNTYFNTYTGSIDVYASRFLFSFRPLYYQTKSGPDSILYRLHVRFYADNPDQYVGLIGYIGSSPDLFNLFTVNFLRVREKIIMAESQFVINKSLLFQLGGGYENQQFPDNRERGLFYLNVGLKYRFGHV
ncbi:YaiO family outer membrane beta-barrel protein [Legionella oakridgensis]|uniref:YaiO family outer membrane beta-barrel protein n=1 Tax=Legionella oakridgensis TaxID=29423 RepID=UPI0007D09E58|nr:YaiO family outer membrane beta-barrel protein [Legionella oakridgensis]